jgi:hypothetical protein
MRREMTASPFTPAVIAVAVVANNAAAAAIFPLVDDRRSEGVAHMEAKRTCGSGGSGFRCRDWARIHRLSCGLVYDSFYDESRL